METAMRKLNSLVIVSMAAFAVACGRNSPKVDDALKNDLALASQAQAYNPQQFISPTEAGLAANPYAPQTIQTVARQPVATARRTTSTARRSSSGGGGYYPAPAPRTETVKHTHRDAAIGAAAGAVIGAVTARDKVKGGLIGGAAGAILGAVIGNNVDIQRRQVP
jgi:hypothetical protein